MTNLHVVILAAGKGTRMKSAVSKVVHPLAGRPLIEHVIRTAAVLEPATITVVVGHGADDVRAALANWPNVRFVVQSPQLGTGHALLQTEPVLAGQQGRVLLLYGDVPLLTVDTLRQLLDRHQSTSAWLTVLTATVPDPYGYGRIIRDQGRIVRIVEERDAGEGEHAIREINSGIYVFELDGLFGALRSLATDNAQGEYYLTDLVAGSVREGRRVETLPIADHVEVRGVNTRVDLAELTRVLRDRTRRRLMLAGVTLENPDSVYVDDGVEIGEDTVIGPNVVLSGATRLGPGGRIGPGPRISDSVLGAGVTDLDHCVIVQSTIDDGCTLGPFAHLRPESRLGAGARVGNFVELKKTTLGPNSKANHLAYLGDAVIGANVNIGAGVITCNYDGVSKHQTRIDDGVFVGSDSQLVAPVHVGPGAYVAAGSTITRDVPPGSLAVARSHQINKDGWAERRASRLKDKDKAR